MPKTFVLVLLVIANVMLNFQMVHGVTHSQGIVLPSCMLSHIDF